MVELLEALSRHVEQRYGVTYSPDKEILVTVGVSEALYLAMAATLNPGDEIIIADPCFVAYEPTARMVEAVATMVPTVQSGFQLTAQAVEAAITPRTKALLIASPNNPTGNTFRQKDIEEILSGSEGMVIVDEAYVEYASGSMISRVNEFDNLIVMRTFSKAYSMAGLRVGYSASNPDVAGMMNCVKIPYSLNKLSEGAAIAAVGDQSFIEASVGVVREQRPRLAEGLRRLGFEPFPSDSNFILAKCPVDHAELVSRLRGKGVLIRDFGSKRRTENCVRITVGTEDLNGIVLGKIEEVVSECRSK